MVGTVAKMIDVNAIDESRYALIAVGTRRIKVDKWLADDPYPLAQVVDWPDEGTDRPGLEEQVAAMSARVRKCRELAARASTPGLDSSSLELVELSDDLTVATYNLAAIAPIGPADRLRLLSSPGPSTRLDLMSEILDDVEAMLKFRLS